MYFHVAKNQENNFYNFVRNITMIVRGMDLKEKLGFQLA